MNHLFQNHHNPFYNVKAFAQLFIQLDQTNKTNTRVNALAQFFSSASDEDKVWTIALLSHKRPKRAVSTTLLRQFAATASDIPLWLFEESYHVVGDLAEAIALVLPPPQNNIHEDQSLDYWVRSIDALKKAEDREKESFVTEAWKVMKYEERFVFNKLITGGFRLGVSQKLMTRALSKATGISEDTLALRLMGNWSPFEATFEDLVLSKDGSEQASKPYPFYLAYALEDEPSDLGNIDKWQAEWKWDGIRGQVIKREDQWFVWSRGEELVTPQFPELESIAEVLPNGTVMDGEIIVFKDGQVEGFNLLQSRLGRKKVGKKLMEKAPIAFIAYDLLEEEGLDIRARSLKYRRNALERIVESYRTDQLILSTVLSSDNWGSLVALREQSREHKAEGIMLKRLDAPYLAGRKKGDWWKWKVDPMTIDAVMIYAQRGHGRRANLYSDYTFAVWDDKDLVPFTKAYSGLTDKEFGEVTRFVKKNTIERFGPVRSVTPELVFEIAFEGIRASSRHKSGVALRFPRIHRWRKDKPAEEAGTLEELKDLLDME